MISYENRPSRFVNGGLIISLLIKGRGNGLGDLLQAALTAGEHIGRFGLNVTGFGQSPLGEGRTNQFIDQHGEQDDVPDQGTFGTAKDTVGGGAHAQGHTGLGQQGDAQVLLHGFRALCQDGREVGTDDLSEGTEDNIDDTDDDHGQIRENGEVQRGTAEHKEQGDGRAGPAVRLQHQVLAERAEVAEDGTEHHADQQGGETEGERTDRDLQLADGDGQDHAADDQGVTVAVGVEEPLQPGEAQADQTAEDHGKENFHQRLNDQRGNVGGSVFHGLGNTEGYGEDHQAYGIVQGDNGQQHVRDRTLGLILTDDHQGGGGSGGGSYGAEGNGNGHREQVGHHEMQHDQGNVHADGGDHSLQDTDDGGLLTGLLQGRKPELMTDGEGDEAQGHIGNHGQGVYLLRGVEAQAGYAKTSQYAGPDQDTGHQIGCNVRQAEFDKKPGHQKTGEERDRDQQKCLHKGARILSEILGALITHAGDCNTNGRKSQ